MSNGRQKWLNGRQTPTKLEWPAWDHQKESEIPMRRKKAASHHKKWTPHFDETTPGRIPLSQLPFDLQSKTRHQTFSTIRTWRLANWLANEIKQDRHKRNQTRSTQNHIPFWRHFVGADYPVPTSPQTSIKMKATNSSGHGNIPTVKLTCQWNRTRLTNSIPFWRNFVEADFPVPTSPWTSKCLSQILMVKWKNIVLYKDRKFKINEQV